MNLARFALRNQKIVLFAVLVLALLGVRAYTLAPQSIFPTMTFSRIDVVAEAGDLPADQVRVALTRPLETALQALPAVVRVTATSSQGAAELFVNFSPSTDPRVDLQYVDQAISQLRPSIPAATNLRAVAVNPNSEPVVSYALTSRDLSQAVLRQIALTQIVPKLYGTPGLGQLLVTGGPAAEYHVDLDPARLAALGIGASDVSAALAAANAVRAVGVTQQDYQSYAVVVDASLHDRAALERVAIPTHGGGIVPLSSVATVTLGTAPTTDGVSLSGEHAVIVNAYALPGADTVAMAGVLAARFATVRPSLPVDVGVTKVWDQTTLIVASQTALRDAILIGALLAILVIFAFLRSVRLTLVAAAVIPLAMAIAIFALQLAGQTLNLMSVGGLAVAVGLIIDDAIVVIENISRNGHERPNMPAADVIALSAAQLARPMIASTAATVVVFLPLGLLSGVAGFFFRALAFTLSASLLVSLMLALLVAPIVARALMGGAQPEEPRHDPVGTILGRYDGVLRWALGHRGIVAAASAVVLVVTVLLLSGLPSDFLPKMDEGQFEIGYTMPPGTSLAASDAAGTTMERVIRADPAVLSVARLTGIDSNGFSPTPANVGLLRVRLIEPENRPGYETVSDRLRDNLQATVPAALFDFRQILEDLINDLSGTTPAPVEIGIYGPDQATLVRLASAVSDAISKLPGIVDPSPGVTYDSPSLRVSPRGASLAALGISSGDLGDALAALGTGSLATSVSNGRALLGVRVRVATPGNSADVLAGGASVYAKGATTTLRDLADLGTIRLSSDLLSDNGQPLLRVTANITGASLSAVTSEIGATLKTIPLPPGYSFEIGGQAQTQKQSFSEFLTVIAIAVALVFAVMLATFGSFRLPLVILTAVPLALIGVALGLALTRTPFNVSSFMGLLLLVGVVVKNGILLIDVANDRRRAGATVEDALLAAGKTRLRPILMTTLAAIGGLFPLALGIGQGAEMERPLAIAVIGGLSTATAFTLVVIPVLYAAFAGGRPRIPVGVLAAGAALVVLVLFAPQPALAAGPSPALGFAGLTLSNAQTAAVAQSPDVAAAGARLDQSRYELAAARGGFAPSLVGSYAQVPQGNPPGPNITSRQASAGIQVTIGDLLALAPNVRAAAFALEAAQSDEHAAEAGERIKVTGAYFDALKTRAIADARRSAVTAAGAQRDAARLRASAGDAPQLDVIRAEVTLAKATADLETANAQADNAREALRIETGVGDAALIETVAAPVPSPNPASTDPAIAVALARRLRPEILSARRTASAAEAAVASARAARFPTVTLTGGYVAGTDSGVPIDAPIINAQLAIPLSGAGGQKVAAARARAAEAQAHASAVERQIVLEVGAAARMLGAMLRAADATERALASAEAELNATELGYRNGASSSLEVTAARATYVQALVDELSSRYDAAKALATLNIEIGT